MALNTIHVPTLNRGVELATLEHYDLIDSTQTRAKELAQCSVTELPALVVADAQMAGRGRGSNQWWASTGSLTFSYVVDAAQFGLQTHRLSSVSLAIGLAIEAEVRSIVGEGHSGLKWPNDVFLDGRKIAGILIETLLVGRDSRLVIGVGVNVNNTLREAPTDVANIATSLLDFTQHSFDLTAVLLNVVQGVNRELAAHATDDWDQSRRWNSRSILTGRQITLDSASGEHHGKCVEIDRDGALVLETATGAVPFVSGVVRAISPPLDEQSGT